MTNHDPKVNKILSRVKIAMSEGNLDDAKNSLNQAKQIGALGKAINDLTQTLSHAFLSRGSLEQQSGNLSSAINNLQHAIQLSPANADAHFSIGSLFVAKGELTTAISSYQKALQIKPDFVAAYHNMGVSQIQLGQLSESIKTFKNALDFAPNSADLHCSLGAALYNHGDIQSAKKSYLKALKIDPHLIKAHNNIGLAYQKEGDIRQAIKKYKATLALDPNHISSFLNLESLYVQIHNGDNDSILNRFRKNTSLNSKLKSSRKDQIYQAISSFLRSDRSATENFLNKYHALSQITSHEYHSKEDQKFCSTYSQFISLLLKSNLGVLTKTKIYHIGESHCLTYANQNIKLEESYSVAAQITFGAKAYHFSEESHNSFKSITSLNLQKIPSNSIVFITFGEIDCRQDEGLIVAAKRLGRPLEDLARVTVENYVNWFVKKTKETGIKLHFFNVPAPGYNKRITETENKLRNSCVRIFNEQLQKKLDRSKIKLIDVYKETSNIDGYSNRVYHCDEFHLDSRILPKVESQLRTLL
jgi:tetratricopeptide (TPR) repeat protein